ncbi:MAG: L,D-transpeptidase family protein [Kiritimatiellae bacterium]|jgi:hypothetical protein|nr:L,D-transpeptidase family protein [Kiritimatiellia bacterium]
MSPPRLFALLLLLGLCAVVLVFRAQFRRPVAAALQSARGRTTVADRVAQFGRPVRERLAPDFARIGASCPPSRLVLAAFKSERRLEAWVPGSDGGWRLLKTWPILGLSGTLGPKLREGDRQVPEGLYRIESLNPNSLYHLSLRVDYPNARDRQRGREEGRTDLGGDIMIHGNTCSIGCLAMGDPAAEELFVLAAETGLDRIRVILSPVDFRVRGLPADRPPVPAWTDRLYADIRRELAALPPP